MSDQNLFDHTKQLDVDRLRLYWGGWIIIVAMVCMLIALAMLVMLPKGNAQGGVDITAIADALARMGWIATFLTGLVATFFGVSASSSAGAQSVASSAVAANAAKAAGDAAGQAASASATAAIAARELAQSAQEVAGRAVDPEMARTIMPRMAAAPAEDIEALRQDPDAPEETLHMPLGYEQVFDRFFAAPQGARAVLNGPRIFQRAIDVAEDEAKAGVSRSSNRARVTEYLNLLGFNFSDNGKPVPFCAAGLTWAVCHAICDETGIALNDQNRLHVFRSVLPQVRSFFKPSASCKSIMDDARARGTLGSEPKPGYLVLYNWSGGTHPQHIGLVISADSDTLKTVEFNTSKAGSQDNGGAVAMKSRDRKYAIGYVRTS